MKKLKILSIAVVLFLVGCTTSNESKADASVEPESQVEPMSTEPESSGNPIASASSATPSSAPKSSTSTSSQTGNIPAEGDYSQLRANCKNYVDAMRNQQKQVSNDYIYDKNSLVNQSNSVDIANYEDPTNEPKETKSDHSYGVTLKFNSRDNMSTYKIEYGLKSDFSDAITVNNARPDGTVIKNLFIAKTYYWRVKTADGTVVPNEGGNFTTGDYPRWIDCGAMYNVRDMGGYMTSYGKRVKQGMVFRGGEITHKAWADDHTFTGDAAAKEVFRNTMKIGFELDLRRNSDFAANDPYTSCAFAENNDISYQKIEINSFANGVRNDGAKIKSIFEILANADQKPVYYHCHGGADRTGTIGFLLNAVLGVSYTDLIIDYELTSYSSIGDRNCKRSHLRSGQYNDFPGFMNTITGLKVNNQNIWDNSKSIKDNAEAYLTKYAGVAQSTINKIRQIMLED